jgi:hypothetical protein
MGIEQVENLVIGSGVAGKILGWTKGWGLCSPVRSRRQHRHSRVPKWHKPSALAPPSGGT